jgi:catechol 2,3-dioxygenase-like lactoylglutathione lyase family enzyme
MTSLHTLTLEVADVPAARTFYDSAFGLSSGLSSGLGPRLELRASETPTTGFRGFTLSLVVAQPATVTRLVDAALEAGATSLKPVSKSLWGHGGVVQAPDGTIWKVATPAKKDTGPDTGQVDSVVLLLGVADVAATKRFYVDRGLVVAKGFGSRYVEFESGSSPLKLALYRRRALAKDAGVPPEGTGSHRITIGSELDDFIDPDGFAWQKVTQPASTA